MKRPLSPPGRIAAVALALLLAAPLASAEDLMQIFRDAERNDPTLAAARAQWEATQEKVPQARSTLLPNVSATVSANANQYNAKFFSDPSVSVNRGFGFGAGTISATQPLYRYGNQVAYEQAKQQVEQSDFNLASSRQDLVLRVAQAYFDVLLAQFNVELAESQLAAVNEQLAQAKRNFEVGVATITDTNDAQAKHDQIVAQQIAAQNDLDNKRTALRVIIGRPPGDLRRLGRGFDPPSPSPNDQDYWINRALAENLSVRVAQYNYDIAALEVDRQRAGHLPTLDLVGSFNAQGANASPTSPVQQSSTQALIGLALNIPIYQGGFVDSRIREAISLQENARDTLEATRRNALFQAQTGFTGVNSAAASVRALEQAVISAQTSYESNRTGLEVGVRTTLDVLNTQQVVFQTRRDLAQAYFNYIIGVLRLKAAVGGLTDADLEDINRRLQG